MELDCKCLPLVGSMYSSLVWMMAVCGLGQYPAVKLCSIGDWMSVLWMDVMLFQRWWCLSRYQLHDRLREDCLLLVGVSVLIFLSSVTNIYRKSFRKRLSPLA